MQLDGWHLLFEECLLDLTYLYNLNVTKTSKSRLLLDYMFVRSDYYIRVMQISEGPSSTLAVKKHNAFSVAFFCSFFQIRGLLQAFFWKHTFKFQVNHWMEFWKPWAGHSWQFELQDWKLHVSNSFDREFRSKKDLQKTEHEAVKTLVHSGYVNIISRTAECESLVVCFFSMVMGHFDTSWFSQGVNSLILGLKNEEWEIFNLNVILVHTQTILEVMEIVVQFHCLSLYQICIETTLYQRYWFPFLSMLLLTQHLKSLWE